MNHYHHFAHLDSIETGLQVGMKIKRGDLLGQVGNTGASTAPHLHWEIHRRKPATWNGYVWGMSKTAVEAKYLDPEPFSSHVENLPMKWDHLSNGWLTPISSGSQTGFHPGWDMNWGSGWDDYKFEVRAPIDGEIAYTGNGGGWGNHLFMKEEDDLGQAYDNHYIQETEESGSFALVYGDEKHFVTGDRAGLASLTVMARDMTFSAVTKAIWNEIPSGDNF